MVKIIFEVNKLAIAYIMQLRKIRDFRVGRKRWNRLLRGTQTEGDEFIIREVEKGLELEYAASENLKEVVEEEWMEHERDVLAWLKELTKVTFTEPVVRLCVVPFNAGQTPFKDVPLIVVGKIREGWGYPETIAHELAHILFNQNFSFEDEKEHPYIQLLEEEIAIRLGARSGYFDYEIPAFAEWVHEAREEEDAWRHYLQNIGDYEDIAQFIRTRIR